MTWGVGAEPHSGAFVCGRPMTLSRAARLFLRFRCHGRACSPPVLAVASGAGLAPRGRMNSDRQTTEKQNRTTKNGNGGSSQASGKGTSTALTRAEDLAVQAKDYLAELPKTFKEEIQSRPYRTLGIAAAVGLGAGVILNSRLLRAVVASAASVAIAEVGRGYLRGIVTKEFGSFMSDDKGSESKAS